jgi:hypothetical protein
MRAPALIGAAIVLAMLVGGLASAQHSPPSGASSPRAEEPYSIEAFGVFRDLMLQGDFTPKVAIGLVMSRLPSTGVGAVSGARGEITGEACKDFILPAVGAKHLCAISSLRQALATRDDKVRPADALAPASPERLDLKPFSRRQFSLR